VGEAPEGSAIPLLSPHQAKRHPPQPQRVAPAAAAATAPVAATAPPLLPLPRRARRAHHYTPLRPTEGQVRVAVERMEEHVRTVCEDLQVEPSQLAICVDIDDTLLCYADPYDRFNHDIVAIPLGMALYHKAVQLGMRIFIVTARSESEGARRDTRDQLQSIGVTTIHELVLCPASVPPYLGTVSAFKREARIRLAIEYDVHIAVNVGDQWSDLYMLDGSEFMNLYRDFHSSRPYILTTQQQTLLVKLPHSCRMQVSSEDVHEDAGTASDDSG